MFKHWTLPPLAPDVFVALDASPPTDPKNKAYFMWEYKKAPEVVVEVVSNKEGNELGSKFDTYAEWGVQYYVVFDPYRHLGPDTLQVFALRGGSLQRSTGWYLPRVGLGVKLWTGVFEDYEAMYLRWCDADGALLLLGEERAVRSDARAKQADQDRDRLIALLRRHGIDPDQR